jgi:hypothetical protein
VVRTLFYRLDRERTGCPRPALIPPDQRFQGLGILEKAHTNPHVHLLLLCQNDVEQSTAADFLLEVLDNVPKKRSDPRDEQWQEEAWDRILKSGARGDDLLLCRKSSMLTALAPAGTAMVQLIRNAEDLEKVARYMTKSWFQSQHYLSTCPNDELVEQSMDWKLLSDFHAGVPLNRQARQHRIDRMSGNPLTKTASALWKSDGVRIRPRRATP